jgi:hypothetical protein
MNRLAAVLAADSASTVTHWGKNGAEVRYFKGANKIFQLSNHAAVGIMIYDSSEILRVPWEIVIKEFRTELGKKTFNRLSEYGQEFFNFISSSSFLFPQLAQEQYLINSVGNATYREINNVVGGISDFAARGPAISDFIARELPIARARTINPPLSMDLVHQLLPAIQDKVSIDIQKTIDSIVSITPNLLHDAVEFSMIKLFSDPWNYNNNTGIVIAGFGDHDIFPSLSEYEICGVISSTSLVREKYHEDVTHDKPTLLRAFAQTSMADTFSIGISADIYWLLASELFPGMNDLVTQIGSEVGFDPTTISDLNGKITGSIQKVLESVLKRAQDDHALPLRRVLGVLPVDEMAELAETLINLQSLKEKVTKPSATVGGPVDIAVITRNEGMVWIKRKHYFDPNLNSRYTLRQSAALR